MRLFMDEYGQKPALLDFLSTTQGVYGIVVDMRMFDIELLAAGFREMLWNALSLQREWLLVTDRLAAGLQSAVIDCIAGLGSTASASTGGPA